MQDRIPAGKFKLKASPPTTIRITIAKETRGTGIIPAFIPFPLCTGAAQTAVEGRMLPAMFAFGANKKPNLEPAPG